MYIIKITITDTETTGLKSGEGAIAQISIITIEETEEEPKVKIKGYNRYLKCGKIDYRASQVSGLTQRRVEFLSKGVTFKDVAQEIYEELNDTHFVAYNIPFDKRFIKAEFESCNMEIEYSQETCALKEQRKITKGTEFERARLENEEKVNTLEAAMTFHKITNQDVDIAVQKIYKTKELQSHDARWDTTATLFVLAGQGNELAQKAVKLLEGMNEN